MYLRKHKASWSGADHQYIAQKGVISSCPSISCTGAGRALSLEAARGGGDGIGGESGCHLDGLGMDRRARAGAGTG
jgi:hypothetical protein